MKLQAYRCIKSFFIESSIIKRTYHCTTPLYDVHHYTLFFRICRGIKKQHHAIFQSDKNWNLFLLIIVCDLGVRLLNCTIFRFWNVSRQILAWFPRERKFLKLKFDCLSMTLVLKEKGASSQSCGVFYQKSSFEV
jgi:hypothetical protein